MKQNLDSVRLEPASGNKAKNLVVFLHGFGANGQDLIGIGRQWGNLLPDTAFVSPDAPHQCDAPGSTGYQWFSLEDRNPQKILEQVEEVNPILSKFIDEELEKRELTNDNLAIVGFSQGGLMTYYNAPRREEPCASIVGFSGLMADPQGLSDPAKIVKMPVLAVHGDADDIVHPDNLTWINDAFVAGGFEIETIMRPDIGHGIDEFSMIRGGNFIKEHFDNK